MIITEIHKKISDCGRKLAPASISAFTEDGRIHPPTIVAANARMSGLFLFKSFNINTDKIPPGECILSPQSSEKTPLLIRTCANILAALGKQIPNTPPDFNFPDSVKPRIDFLATQKILEPVFIPYQDEFQLDNEQMARAAAVASGVVIYTVSKNLDYVEAFSLACFSFFEGTKTVPAKF